MKPRSLADRRISSFTTKGSRESAGPQKTRYARVAARNVPHSQVCVRTSRNPSRISAIIDAGTSAAAWRARGRMASRQEIETPKVSPSARKAPPALPPKTAMSQPPIAGPAIR